MKRLITLSLVLSTLFICDNSLYAQNYNWVKGGATSMDLTSSLYDEEVAKMCTDDNGNVYTLGVIGYGAIVADTFHRTGAYGGHNNVFITSYNRSGQMRWAKLIGSANDSQPYDISTDNHGHIYVSGWIPHVAGAHTEYIGYDTSFSTYQYLATALIQFDTLGEFNWIKYIGENTFAGLSLMGFYNSQLLMDGSENVHFLCDMKSGVPITASITSHYGIYDIVYDQTGSLLSATRLQLDSTLEVDFATIDESTGKLYVVGTRGNEFYGPMSYHPYIAAFDLSRNLIWTDTLSNTIVPGPGSAVFGDIAADGYGNLYLTASAPGMFIYRHDTATNNLSPGGYNITSILKMNTSGDLEWMRTFGATTNLNGMAALTLMPNNKIAAAGMMLGQVACGTHSITSYASETQNAYFTILDSAGYIHDLQQIHGSGNNDVANAVTSDNVGNLYIGGQISTNIWGGSLAPYTSIGGNTDYFIMKYGVDDSCTTMPVANYTVAGGITKIFTYTGTTAGIDSVRWDFGDGGTSTAMSPTHTYTTGDTFTACITVYTGCGSDMHCSDFIIPCVSAPTAAYSTSGTGLTKTFTYTGTGLGIGTLSWDFGDGTSPGTTTPAAHTFSAAGTYNVCLTAANSCGTNTSCTSVIVTCASAPVSNYTTSGTGLTKSFTYTGTSSGIDSVTWTFGDGGTVTGLNPSHTYAIAGTYTVCATVHSNCGTNIHCSSVVVTCSTLPVSAFSSTGPDLSKSFFYTGTSTGMDSVTWTFGDGGTATGTAPVHTYLSAGTYTVCATVHTNCGANTLCSAILVSCSSLPVAAFTLTGTGATYTFAYTGTTAGMDSVRWDFGDGGISSSLSPSHTFAGDGTYHVCVTVYTNCGSSTICHDVVISCVSPIVANFTDTGHVTHGFAYTGTTSAIDSIVWTYGDGHRDTGMYALHTYAVRDTYHVCVIVYTYCGSNTVCRDIIITYAAGVDNIVLGDIKVYPNPATSELYISSISQPTDYRLLSVTGVSIQQGRLHQGNNIVSLPDVAAGVYMLELTGADGQRNIIRIVKQ